MGRFSEAIARNVLLFDGSMGALIGQMGYKTACPDEMATTHREVIMEIHQKYLNAGANVLIADTFGSTEMALAHKGKAGMGKTFIKNAVTLAREAAGGQALVAVDMGPTSEFMYPVGAYKMEAFFETYLEQAEAAREAGCDFAIIETQTDVSECRAACLAARKAGVEAAASFTFQNGRTLTGSGPECCALILQAAGAKALGVNCSTGPEQMLPILKAMRRVTDLPIIIQPNAGLPQTAADGSVYYPFTPDDMLESMRAIVENGAGAIGGCCGTTPEHIKKLSELAFGEAKPSEKEDAEYVCSQRVFVDLSEAVSDIQTFDDPEDLYDLDEDTSLVLIDLTGMSAKEARDFTEECAAMCRNPFAFKADSREALSAALHIYAGVAAVMADESMADIIEYYGAKRIS